MARELRLVVTQRCQNKCSYCHREGMSGKECERLYPRDYRYLFEVVRQQLGIDRVTITGGEPLLRKDINTIIKLLRISGAKIKLISNGILLSKKLSLLPLVDEICISMVSLDPKKYQKIHQTNSLNIILDGINKSQKIRGRARIRLNICVYKGINDNKIDIKRFIDMATEKGVMLKFIELLGVDKSTYASIAKISKILDDLGVNFLGKKHEKWFYGNNSKSIIELQRCPCANVKIVQDLDYFCKTENDIFISPDGKIKPCMLKKGGEIDILEAVKQRDKEMMGLYLRQTQEQFGINCPMMK